MGVTNLIKCEIIQNIIKRRARQVVERVAKVKIVVDKVLIKRAREVVEKVAEVNIVVEKVLETVAKERKG